jgi:hypothetical protein
MNDVTGRDVVERCVRLRNETTTLDYNDLVGEDLTDEDVARLWLSIDSYQASVNAAVKAVGDEWVRRYTARGNHAIELDGFLVTTKKGYTRERCIDPEQFLAWLAENPETVPAILNPNSIKFGSLPPAVRQTFFSKEDVIHPDAQPKPAAIPIEVLNRQKASE